MFTSQPLRVIGLLVPKKTKIHENSTYYTLATEEGEEYYLLPNAKWDPVLHYFEWTQVFVLGEVDLERKLIRIKNLGPVERDAGFDVADAAYDSSLDSDWWSWLKEVRHAIILYLVFATA